MMGDFTRDTNRISTQSRIIVNAVTDGIDGTFGNGKPAEAKPAESFDDVPESLRQKKSDGGVPQQKLGESVPVETVEVGNATKAQPESKVASKGPNMNKSMNTWKANVQAFDELFESTRMGIEGFGSTSAN